MGGLGVNGMIKGVYHGVATVGTTGEAVAKISASPLICGYQTVKAMAEIEEREEKAAKEEEEKRAKMKELKD